jgi:hypothetical protein
MTGEDRSILRKKNPVSLCSQLPLGVWSDFGSRRQQAEDKTQKPYDRFTFQGPRVIQRYNRRLDCPWRHYGRDSKEIYFCLFRKSIPRNPTGTKAYYLLFDTVTFAKIAPVFW